MIGLTIAIILEINPNFLPDSSDMPYALMVV